MRIEPMTSSRIASGSDESEGNGPGIGGGLSLIADAAIDASISGASERPDGGRFAARMAVPIHFSSPLSRRGIQQV